MRENRACLFFFFLLTNKWKRFEKRKMEMLKPKSLSQNFARLPQDSIQ